MATDSRSRAFLASVRRGEVITAADIDRLLLEREPEDGWLDYKRAWSSLSTGVAKMKKHVSGFANADGGVLLVGVAGGEGDEPRWKVTGIGELGDPAHWASEAIKRLSPHLVPTPIIQVVEHPDGKVLVVAVERSESLVPVIESQAVTYYLRIGPCTQPVPSWLHADLTLGRRRHPTFSVDGAVRIAFEWRGGFSSLTAALSVSNESFQWAEDVRVGVVGVAIPDGPHYENHTEQYVSAAGPAFDACLNFGGRTRSALQRCERSLGTMEPFAHRELRLYLAIANEGVLEMGPDRRPMAGTASWRGGLYFFGRNAPPRWWQISIDVDMITTNQTRQELSPIPTGERALVRWARI